MREFQVDGDVIAEVVAYLNGHKTVPAQRMADAVLRLLNRHYQDAAALEAAREERDELAKDAAKYRWGINNARWIRSEQEAYVAIPVAPDADLSCIAMRDAAIDQARGKGGGNG